MSGLGNRTGDHCEKIHQEVVEQGKLNLLHVQVDEIRVKGREMIAWMGLTIMVSTRLWIAGEVSRTQDTKLADRVLYQVRCCRQAACSLLICTDGWRSIQRVSREHSETKSKERWEKEGRHLFCGLIFALGRWSNEASRCR